MPAYGVIILSILVVFAGSYRRVLRKTYLGRFKTEWGDLAAASMLVTVPALVVFYVVQRYPVSGLTVGGTKG